MKNFKIIGLTGQSGAGKSTVASLFRAESISVIDADKLVEKLYAPNSICIEVLVALFGYDIIDSDGVLDRANLADIVFTSRDNLMKLNSVVHPFVMSLFLDELRYESESGESIIVYDAPQLFEGKADIICDKIISVTADKKVRAERICKRDGISEKQALQRIEAQYNEKFYKNNSDYVIENNDDYYSLEQQFKKILPEILT